MLEHSIGGFDFFTLNQFKDMKFLLENPFRQREKINEVEHFEKTLRNRLGDKYTQKSFAERFKNVRAAAFVSTYFSNAYSFLTGAAAICLFVCLGLDNAWPLWVNVSLGSVLGIFVALGLEIFKRNLTSETLKEGFSTKSWSISGMLGILALMAISTGLSFFTSQALPGQTIPPPTVVAVDTSQYATYQAAIDRKRQQIEDIKKQRQWKGRIGHKDQKEINKLNELLQQDEQGFITHQNEKKAEANQANALKSENFESEKSSNRLILGWVTIGSELLFIINFIYVERYDWKAFKERVNSDHGNAVHEEDDFEIPTEDQKHNQQRPHPKTAQNQIGFKQYDYDLDKFVDRELPPELPGTETQGTEIRTETVPDGTEGVPPDVTYVLADNEKPCEWCGTVMTYKYTRKKYCSPQCRKEAHLAKSKEDEKKG